MCIYMCLCVCVSVCACVGGVCVGVCMSYVGGDREALSNHIKTLEKGMFTDGQSDRLLCNPALVVGVKCNAAGREYAPVLLLYLHTYVCTLCAPVSASTITLPSCMQPASNAILVKTPKFPFASLITKPFQVKVRVRSGKQQQESSNHMTFTYQPPGECGAM